MAAHARLLSIPTADIVRGFSIPKNEGTRVDRTKAYSTRLASAGADADEARASTRSSEDEKGSTRPVRSFIVCANCGNKRCLKATWHGYKCTRSTRPGRSGMKEMQRIGLANGPCR